MLDKWLVENFIKDLNNDSSKKIVVVYAGRFQPWHIGHKKVYDYIVSLFGDCFIVTTNRIKPPKSILNFSEKIEFIKKSGIPENKIHMVLHPYSPILIKNGHKKIPVGWDKLLQNYDLNKTIFIIFLGEKDAKRLQDGILYQPYEKNKNNLLTMDKKLYYAIVPQEKSTIMIDNIPLSASRIRNFLSSNNSIEEKKIFFKKVMGYYDKKLFDMITTKIKTISEILTEGGGYGHMMHIFDDLSLKFEDLKNIIRTSLQGTISHEIKEKCINGESLIELKNNGIKTIKDVVDNKIMDDVLSFDEMNMKSEYKSIIGYADNGKTNEWLEIELENGKKIVVTSNHRIYTNSGIIEAKNLKIGDNLISQ